VESDQSYLNYVHNASVATGHFGSTVGLNVLAGPKHVKLPVAIGSPTMTKSRSRSVSGYHSKTGSVSSVSSQQKQKPTSRGSTSNLRDPVAQAACKQATQFASQFQKLFENLKQIYPTMEEPKISSSLTPQDFLPALDFFQ
jgi:hypothetical protein